MKKKNYNWKLNQAKLSKAEVDAHKDFDKILGEFNQSAPDQPKEPKKPRRLFRRLAVIGGAIAAALVEVLMFLGIDGKKENTSPATFKDYAATQPYVNPPLGEKVQAQFISKSISANAGGVFEFDNGSKVTVPPAAFTYGQGGIVEGDVEIRFREYHDFVDFFLSGIPMEYDSAGTRYTLESAGMVEIIAEQDGKRLNMAPGKSIDVELISQVNLDENGQVPNFNIYYLDTVQRNWVYEGVDQISRIDDEFDDSVVASLSEEKLVEDFQKEIANIQQQQAKKIADIERELPVIVKPNKPQKANGTGQVFDFTFEQDQIDYGTKVPGTNVEQLRLADEQVRKLRAQYANTNWQFSPKNENFDQTAVRQNTWDDMSLKFIGGQEYQLTLKGGDNSLTFLVNPVLMGRNYKNALEQFNSQMATYETELAERKAFMAEKIAAVKADQKEEERLASMAHDEKIAVLKAKGLDHRVTDEVLQAKIVNKFTARRLGVWNCDRPLPYGWLALKSNFKGSDQTNYNHNIAYLVDKNLNTVSRFYTEKDCRIQVNLKSKNLLWIITPDNKIAIHKPEQFKKINVKRKKLSEPIDHTFVMNLVDKPIDSEEDIRKILEF